MPRRPVTSFTATSLGSLLREDGLYRPPQAPSPAVVAKSISGFEAAASKKREAHVQDAATTAAQRYLAERAKASASPEHIWGIARNVSKGIISPDLGILQPVIPRHVRTTFDAFDVTSTGYLEHRELRNALQYLGFNTSNFGAASILAAYDDHPDGKLDLVEFARLVADAERGGVYADPTAAARAAADIVPPRVRAAFNFFDVDGSGFIDADELRSALRHYGIDLTKAGAQEVLEAYDTHPDGKLEISEFHEIIRDATRGFVLAGESGRVFSTGGGGGGGGSGGGGGVAPAGDSGGAAFASNEGRLGNLWPHHQEEEARMQQIRSDLASGRGSWTRDKLHQPNGSVFSDANGEWVRQQLLSEQHGRKSAEAEAAVAKAEAAAAIARVEALQAAAAARELEIEAAAARQYRTEVLQPGKRGGGGGGGGGGGEKRSKEVMTTLVARLEVGLLDRADARAKEDTDTARLAVLRRTFRNPMVGTAPTDKFIGVREFLNAMGVLGLPQPPAVLPAKNATTGVQPDVRSDDSLNEEVLLAFFDKYKEPDGMLNYETLYARVSRNAVRVKHGQWASQAATQRAYQDGLQRSKYQQNGRPFTSAPMYRPKFLLQSPVGDRSSVAHR